jgi:hypothetical protein
VGIIPLVLTACGGGTAGGAAGSSTTSALTTSYSNALPIPSQLAVGTLKLAGTSQAVTAAQASQLLPLWEAYRSLLSSGTAADAEYQGLQRQIEAAMTSAQLQSIAAMRLTAEDMTTAMAQQSGGPMASGTAMPRSSDPMTFSEGGPPGGGPGPGGGGGFVVGGDFGGGPGGAVVSGGPSTSSTAQPQATAQAASTAAGVNARLVSAVIRMLQRMTIATPTP